MTENIGLRVRFEDLFVVVVPTAGERFDINVTDALGREPLDEEKRRRALQHLLRSLSDLRGQVWKMLGGEVLT
jgi:hypothetical protein